METKIEQGVVSRRIFVGESFARVDTEGGNGGKANDDLLEVIGSRVEPPEASSANDESDQGRDQLP
jgi:hypothetical protein